jgi:hypothetical protein
MELSSSVFEMVQLGGVEYFIRLCCGVTGFFGFILGMSMICRALFLWSEKSLGFSQSEKQWFIEGELESKIEYEMEMSRRSFLSGAKGLPSPQEMDASIKEFSTYEFMSRRGEKKARARVASRFLRSHFRSSFQFEVVMVNLPVFEEEAIEVEENNQQGATILTFLKEKAKKPLNTGLHDGRPIYEVPIANMGAGIKTYQAIYSV